MSVFTGDCPCIPCRRPDERPSAGKPGRIPAAASPARQDSASGNVAVQGGIHVSPGAIRYPRNHDPSGGMYLVRSFRFRFGRTAYGITPASRSGLHCCVSSRHPRPACPVHQASTQQPLPSIHRGQFPDAGSACRRGAPRPGWSRPPARSARSRSIRQRRCGSAGPRCRGRRRERSSGRGSRARSRPSRGLSDCMSMMTRGRRFRVEQARCKLKSPSHRFNNGDVPGPGKPFPGRRSHPDSRQHVRIARRGPCCVRPMVARDNHKSCRCPVGVAGAPATTALHRPCRKPAAVLEREVSAVQMQAVPLRNG